MENRVVLVFTDRVVRLDHKCCGKGMFQQVEPLSHSVNARGAESNSKEQGWRVEF